MHQNRESLRKSKLFPTLMKMKTSYCMMNQIMTKMLRIVTPGIDKDESDKQQTNILKSEVGKYFAVYWENLRIYHWGKLLKVFQDDVDGQAKKAEFKFLHKKSGIDGESMLGLAYC